MSRIDFSRLAKQPELKDTLRQIDGWVERHPHETFLDPRRLTRELRAASPVLLAAALSVLAGNGVVKPAFKVIAPNHVMADETFSTLDEIKSLNTIYDTDHDPFDPNAADVVQVFLLPEHASQLHSFFVSLSVCMMPRHDRFHPTLRRLHSSGGD
jgi:hypothetical protein